MREMMERAKAFRSPEAFLDNLSQTNPKAKEVRELISQYGDPKTAFYARAKQLGVDPNSILRMLG